jgi:DNA-binding transcriptional LysR family regulator
MNFRTLDLNLLRVFDVVMSERNVTRAAERLAMSQPAASNALRRLREAVGDELFVPGPTGVAPTRLAEALWPTVRAALTGLRDLLEPPRFDPRSDERSFTLAMADATAAVAVPSVMNLLDAAGSRAGLRVVPLTTRDPRALLARGDADLALGFFPGLAQALNTEGAATTTRVADVWTCEYVCVMRRAHPLAATTTLDLDAYLSARHVRVSVTGGARDYVDDALAHVGRERRVVLTVNQFHSAACIIRQSDLLAVLPRSFVPATGFADALTCRTLPLGLPGIDVSMAWHLRHDADPAQRWLRARIEEAVPALLAASRKVAQAGCLAEALPA